MRHDPVDLQDPVAFFLYSAPARHCPAGKAWTISGIVYGGNGPLPDVVITAYDSGDGGEVTTATTGADGTFNLLISPPTESGYPNSVVNGVGVSGADVAQNVVLLQHAVTLSGVVRLPDGSPVKGVMVYIHEQTSAIRLGTVLTEADGVYEFSLAQGSVNVAS